MKNSILVTGSSGLLGKAFQSKYNSENFIYFSSKDYNLLDENKTNQLISKYKPEFVIHLASKVGGVKSNIDNMSDFFLNNIKINTNVLNACHAHGVQKVISLLSTCIYPDKVKYPLTENQIHNGPPHESNYGYAYSKRMLDIHTKVLRQQYGRNYICAIPNNLYGENDNFDLKNSHVIPALIRKIYESKINNKNVELWSDGSPLREFTYSKDISEILLFLLENYNNDEPINIGNTNEISIKELAKKISNLLDYKGEIIWNTNMPSGQRRKPSCNKKLLELGWKKENYTSLDDGLKSTVNWFLKNYPNVRGI